MDLHEKDSFIVHSFIQQTFTYSTNIKSLPCNVSICIDTYIWINFQLKAEIGRMCKKM